MAHGTDCHPLRLCARRLQQTAAEKTFAHPVGDAFSDICLAYLAEDTRGRLLPTVCPNYTMAPQPASPGQRGCLAQSVVQPKLDDKGRQVRSLCCQSQNTGAETTGLLSCQEAWLYPSANRGTEAMRR